MSRLRCALELTPHEAQVAKRHADAPARAQQLLSTPAICERLGIERHTWRRWVVSRRAPAPVPNLPGHPRWTVEAIENFRRGLYGQAGRRVYFGAARRRHRSASSAQPAPDPVQPRAPRTPDPSQELRELALGRVR